MLGAVAASTLFLAFYLYYHFHAGRTTFKDPAWFRPIYLTILLTHTVLAVAIVPMVIVTLVRALRERFDKHKRMPSSFHAGDYSAALQYLQAVKAAGSDDADKVMAQLRKTKFNDMFVRALRERFDKHKRIARWTLPLWLYVSVTGVVIYFLLYKIFPQR